MENQKAGSRIKALPDPSALPVRERIPDVFSFADGRKVSSAEDWAERAAEIRGLYEYYMYGPLPDGGKERVSYRLSEMRVIDEEVKSFDGSSLHAKARECDLDITVSCGGRSAGFSCKVTLPIKEPGKGGYPVYMEMMFVFGGGEMKPSINAYYAAKRGYATISYEPVKLAADNASRGGVFYEVHPYGGSWEEQTGALAAWGWGASRILDALAGGANVSCADAAQGADAVATGAAGETGMSCVGAAERLHIDWKKNILSGVSRYGKAVLVAGAYDKRIRVVVPACSGAGGAAMYRYRSEGKVYDLAPLGYVDEDGTSLHKTTKNEPLESLQSGDEGHWFNDRFLEFDCVERFPFDQHHLAALSADKDRYLFMIASASGEDWTNPAAMYETYAEARKVYEFLGIPDNIAIEIHLLGHAVLLSDMEKLLDYCDIMLLGKDPASVKTRLAELKRDAYFKEAERHGDNL